MPRPPRMKTASVDPDVNMRDRRRRCELRQHPVVVLLAVSAGGVVGALGRYGLGKALDESSWPWSTWVVNGSGCLLIGVLMALITELWSDQRVLRPFLVVGVLGGYTTFSTATVEVQQLVEHDRPGLGLLYLAGTVLAALLAVLVGSGVTAALLTRRGARKGARQ